MNSMDRMKAKDVPKKDLKNFESKAMSLRYD